MILFYYCQSIVWFLSSLSSGMGLTYLTTEGEEKKPQILPSQTNFTLVKGDSLSLGCDIRHTGESTIVWKHKNNVLSVGDIKVRKDPKMSWRKEANYKNGEKVDSHYLQIANLEREYSGKYTCQVEWKTDSEPIQQIYTLKVLIPPMIRAVLSEIQIEEGEGVVLSCVAQGDPQPSVSWSYQGGVLPPGSRANSTDLTISHVERQHAGVYLCHAFNGAGASVSDRINLQVQYSPHVEAEQRIVSKSLDGSAEISCLVKAEPPAQVSWYKNGLFVDSLHFATSNSTHSTLHIGKVSRSDLGNYTCVAENNIGRGVATVYLSGAPGNVRIVSGNGEISSQQFNLNWTASSFAAITATDIIIRRADIFKIDWKNYTFIHPAHSQYFNRDFQFSFPLKNLEANTKYEIKIKCRNEYGESEYSPSHFFTTRTMDYTASDYNSKYHQEGQKWWYRSHCGNPFCWSATLFLLVTTQLVLRKCI